MIKNVHGNTVDYLVETIVAGRLAGSGALRRLNRCCVRNSVSAALSGGSRSLGNPASRLKAA